MLILLSIYTIILNISYTSSGFESYNKENIIFITFGGPTKEFHEAVSRITKEAKDMDVFNSILGFTDKDLKEDFSFWNKHGQFIENNKRGYGYWIWKPYLTKKTIEKINQNDIIVYADAGCVLNKKGRSRLLEYINMIKNKDPFSKFLVFSNDNEYARTYLNTYKIEYKLSKSKAAYDTLVEMANCAGAICANSSLSWLGAFFQKRAKGMVYMPSKWINGKTTDDLYPSWATIVDTEDYFS